MAKEVSNRTLIILLVLAIVISLGGTLISINRLNMFVMPQITGAIIDPGMGYANYSIAQTTSIAVSQNIEFGDGYVNSSYGEMEGNSSSLKCTNGMGYWDWSTRGIQYIRIINDGNVNVSINVTSNNTPAEFIGGGGAGVDPWRNTSLIYEENSGAITNGACFGTIDLRQYTNLTSTANLTICSNLSFFDADDAINVSVRLIIPENAPMGFKSTLLTFYAEKTPS